MTVSKEEVMNLTDLSGLLMSIQKNLYSTTNYPSPDIINKPDFSCDEEYDPAYPQYSNEAYYSYQQNKTFDGSFDDYKSKQSFDRLGLMDHNKNYNESSDAIHFLNEIQQSFHNYGPLDQGCRNSSVDSKRYDRRHVPYVKRQRPSEPVAFSQKSSLPNDTVFVCNINYAASENDLKMYFETIGAVISVKIMEKDQNGRRKRWAFVKFCDIFTAEKCVKTLNQKVFMDRVMGLSFAHYENRYL